MGLDQVSILIPEIIGIGQVCVAGNAVSAIGRVVRGAGRAAAHSDYITRRAAYANSKDFHAIALGQFRGLNGLTLVVLAISEDHQHLLPCGFINKRLGCRLDHSRQAGPFHRDGAHAHRLNVLPENALLARERALQKGRAGKGHDGKAILRRDLFEFLDGQLGAFQPVGLEVAGQHALGGVDRQHDVQVALGGLDSLRSPARSGKRHHRRRKGQQDQAHAQPLPVRRDARGEIRQQARLDEERHHPFTPAQRPHVKQPQHRQQCQPPELPGFTPGHR